MTWLRLKKISVIVPKRAYFRVFQPTNHLKFHDKDIAKWKKVNLEVKQSPEKPNKELEIMEDISKLLQSTPNSDNWHDGCSRDQIYPLRSKEHQILNQQIACQIPKRRCCCCCSSTNHLWFRHHLRSRRMAIQTQIYPAFRWTSCDSLRKYMNLNISNK